MRLTITNMGGETILLSELRVYAGMSDENVSCIFGLKENEAPSSRELEVENVFSVEYHVSARAGETVFVRVVRAPSTSIIWQGSVKIKT